MSNARRELVPLGNCKLSNQESVCDGTIKLCRLFCIEALRSKHEYDEGWKFNANEEQEEERKEGREGTLVKDD